MEINTENPAQEITVALVNYLRSLAPSLGIDERQIREIYDLSGQQKELAGISVAVIDKGDHPGNVGRILVDCDVTVTAWTHLNDDADGSLCHSLAGGILFAVQSITYDLPSWKVAFKGSWQMSSPTAADTYRAIQLKATLPLVRKSSN